jgi:hydrogenase nickel incorporation protein HypA/HybF
MHELGIAVEILEAVLLEKRERKMKDIREIGIRVGSLSSIDPESLRFCFEASKKDTPLSATDLKIDLVPVEGKCSACGRNFEVEDFIFICPFCGSPDIKVERGQELIISYIMGE